MRPLKLSRTITILSIVMLTALPSAWATITQFHLQGTAGYGLLFGNEPAVASGGTGGEIGNGIFFDDVTSVLTVNAGWGSSQGFTDLSSLANNSHIHGPTTANFGNDGTGNFKQTAAVLFTLTRSGNAVTGGTFTSPSTSITLTAPQKTDLFNGKYYINIHTVNNAGGELRGFLVPGLTQVNIQPPNAPAGTAGTYVLGGGNTFTMTSDGRGFYPNMTLNPTWDGTQWVQPDIDATGDLITFACETITGDFDRRVKITSISADNPTDTWTRGGLMLRTATNHYKASFQVIAANPQGANVVVLTGRALDGQNYTEFDRRLAGVTNALPNQWLRLRRVGNYFTAYVGTNGTSWTLVAQRYQILPATLLVGPHAASGAAGTIATVQFDNYGPTPLTDGVPPTLVSAGTLDKKVVGVRFSEPVQASTATDTSHYAVTNSGGVAATVTSAKMGIASDAVYLTVTGLTADNFSVTVNGIKDVAGNTIVGSPTVAAKALNWNHGDIGYINDTSNRPKPGDDPYPVGQAVMVSSDENPEVEIIGGGSNAWNPGDFIHYVWRTQPLSGNFDVTIGVTRNDHNVISGGGGTGGWANSGLMLRAADYNPGDNPPGTRLTNYAATQVQMVANTTYEEADAPGRASIALWRTATHGGYGNGGIVGWGSVIGGTKGYYSDLRAISASGDVDPLSSADSARYLRIKREGTQYSFYVSFNRTTWALVSVNNLPDLPDQLLLGFSTMNDTGAGTPPYGGYGGLGHQINPADPLNPANTGNTNAGTPVLGVVQNESTYSVQRIKIFPNGVSDPVPASLAFVDIRPPDESPVPPNALSGSWVSTGTYSFNMTGGGTGPFRNLSPPYDGSVGGDELSFAYEAVTGDFDKQVAITSLTNQLYNNNGTAIDITNIVYTLPFPIDQWARAGLMVRDNPTNSYAQCLKLVAMNPAGDSTSGPIPANSVGVIGRGIDAQNYTLYSRTYPGVTNALPNQFLRIKRAGNSFTFYVSKDGVVWARVAQCYQNMPSTIYFGPYCAAGLNPGDAGTNPDGLLSRAIATFTAYRNVDLGDVTGPVLISAGTLNKQTVGVKFNEQVNSATATVPANYSLSQGTVTAAKVGVGGDSVYLTVTGLSADNFTVTVTNVTDLAGNKVAANSTVNAKVTALTSTDIGLIQNPGSRPTVGDDPYRTGQAVATSSDDAAEVEIIGGGSNAWNPGDYLHWLYKPTPMAGNFDVAVKVSRNDRPNNTAGWANSGLMLRTAVYNAGQANTVDGTKVPMMANTTYIENSAPGRAAIPLWRTEEGGNYGNGDPVGWPTLVGGIKGYYTDLRATNASGTLDPESSAFSARWLRIKRVGSTYTCSWGYNGLDWADENIATQPTFTNSTFMLGFSTMNDTGGGAPPFGGYAADGHTVDPLDPLNPANAGGNVQNESNYSVQKVRLYASTASIGAISVARVNGQILITYSGTLVSSGSLNGPWTTVPLQASPYTVNPTGSRLYYRVLP